MEIQVRPIDSYKIKTEKLRSIILGEIDRDTTAAAERRIQSKAASTQIVGELAFGFRHEAGAGARVFYLLQSSEIEILVSNDYFTEAA